MAYILFYASQLLRNSNRIFLLFIKIRGDQLNDFVSHFKNLNNEVNKVRETNSKERFYDIFQELQMQSKKSMTSNRQGYRNINTNLYVPVLPWIAKFLILVSLFFVLIFIRYMFLNKKITQLYNQFWYFKNRSCGGIYFAMNSALISNQLGVIAGIENYNGSFVQNMNYSLIIKENMQKTTSNFHLSHLMIETEEYKSFVFDIWYKNVCQNVSIAPFKCDDPFVFTALSNGWKALFSQNNLLFLKATSIFKTSYNWTSESILKSDLIKELTQIPRLVFPFF